MSTFIGSSLRLNGPAQNNSNQLAGECAGGAITYAQHNNFFGFFAGRCTSVGDCNNFFGFCAGRDNISGNTNNFFGHFAGLSNSNGSRNNFIGGVAGMFNTSGTDNNAFGFRAGCSGTSASGNQFIGRGTGLAITTGSRNVIIGCYAGRKTCIGCENVFVGTLSAQCNTSGGRNSFFGFCAGNCGTTGSYNTALGVCAARLITTGCNNIVIGWNSGTTGVGPQGLFNLTTTNNRIIMGNANHVCAQIQIGWTTVSDVRDKCIYGSIDRGLGFLKGITPIEYQFKDRKNDEITDPLHKRRYGFSAQEILELEGDHPVIVSAEDPDKLQLTTDHLLPVMVNAIKELSAEVETLKERVAILEQ